MERDLFLPEPLTDPDDVPPAPKSPVSRAGQLCSLGSIGCWSGRRPIWMACGHCVVMCSRNACGRAAVWR